MNKIAAVVVTYNRKKLLRESLLALLNQSMANVDIILIDNCSTDGTFEYIVDLIDSQKLKYYKTKSNIGGAGGFNYGLRKAYEEGYDFYWMMDDDSIPERNALEVLWKKANDLNHEYGFLCSNVRWTDGSACLMNIPEISRDWLEDSECIKSGIVPVTKATFVGYFTRREVVEKVGLPIKEFFIWSDDTNFSMRITKFYKSYLVIDSIIVHKMLNNYSASIITDQSGRNERYFYAFRNRFFNARMNGKISKYILEIFTTTIHILVRSKFKLKKLKYMFKGFFAGIFFNPKIEKVVDIDMSNR